MSIDSLKEFNELIDKLEEMPHFQMDEIDSNSVRVSALASIAISLKRIADKLELSQKQPIIMSAEQALFYEANKNGIYKLSSE